MYRWGSIRDSGAAAGEEACEVVSGGLIDACRLFHLVSSHQFFQLSRRSSLAAFSDANAS